MFDEREASWLACLCGLDLLLILLGILLVMTIHLKLRGIIPNGL
jgi:hypothetical protein